MVPVVFPLLEAAAAGDGRKKIPLYEVERAVLAVAELPRRPDYLVQYRLQSCGTGDGTEHAADRALLLPQSLVAPSELLGVECLARAHRTDSTSGFRETAQNDPLTKENLLPLSISAGVGLERVDRAAMDDLAAYENVGAEAGMDEGAKHTRVGEAFEVFTWFAETAPQAFHLADPEALADELAECEAADNEVAAGGCAVDTCTLKRVGLDQGEVTPTLVRVVRVGANPVEVAIAFESTAGNCLHALDR